MTTHVLTMHFGPKFHLPTETKVQLCASDNFAFVTNCEQSDYDEYYAEIANDTVHREVAGDTVRSPIAQLQASHLAEVLPKFFDESRAVLDFGCGTGSLLTELALAFPDSHFYGFDPGPDAALAAQSARTLGLSNLTVQGLEDCFDKGPYDLLILSHVLEHIVDLEVIGVLKTLLKPGGWVYVEVPDALQYCESPRLEFLYYFDRLHVNHFTPTSLANLLGRYGLGYIRHLSYSFPYRDTGSYPALGMVLRDGVVSDPVQSENLSLKFTSYLESEQQRALIKANTLASHKGVLVYGAGDNFFRSLENNGPLSNVDKIVVLVDGGPYEISFRGEISTTMDPLDGLARYDWPLVMTISGSRDAIMRRVQAMDPDRTREVIFL